MKSNCYRWYKSYKNHVCSTSEGVILSCAFITANVQGSKMTPSLLQHVKNRNVLFSIADAAYDSQHIYGAASTCNIFPVNSLNSRKGKETKISHRRVLLTFLQTTFGTQLMKERREIEQQFSKLKDRGLEQPRLYRQNCYLLNVQLVFLIQNIAYLF